MKILVLNASVTGTTFKMYEYINAEMQKRHGNADVTIIDLNKEFDQPLNSNTVSGSFYDKGTYYIDLMQKFDEVIFVGSMINYNIPASLHSFLGKIALPGITFAYDENGIYSPMQGKWKPEIIFLFASGTAKEYYPESAKQIPLAFLDALKLLGMEKISYIWVDGTNMPNVHNLTIEEKIEHFKDKMFNIIKY